MSAKLTGARRASREKNAPKGNISQADNCTVQQVKEKHVRSEFEGEKRRML